MPAPGGGPRRRVTPGSKVAAPGSSNEQSRGRARGAGKTGRASRPPRLTWESDNEATGQWRVGKPENDVAVLPARFDPLQNKDFLLLLSYISATSGTHLEPSKLAKSNVWQVRIWGTPAQCTNVKARLASATSDISADRKWLQRFEKLHGERPYEWHEKQHRELGKETRRQQFRRALTADQVQNTRFRYLVRLPWNQREVRAQDYLGPSLEAIDEIRMDCLCYIYLKEVDGQHSFFLLGDHPKLLERAVARLKAIPSRMISHGLEASNFFLPKPIENLDYGTNVIQQISYFRPKRRMAPTNQDKPAGRVLQVAKGISTIETAGRGNASVICLDQLEKAGSVQLRSRHMEHINKQYLNLWITSALEHLRFYKGYVEMDITLGTCVLQKYHRFDSYSLYEMEDFLQEANSGNEGFLPLRTAELGDQIVEKGLLERVFKSYPSLSLDDCSQFQADKDGSGQVHALEVADCMKSLMPICKAAFTFEHGNQSTLRLELEFHQNPEGEYLLQNGRWLRFDGEQTGSDFMDINIVDIENSQASYRFKIARWEQLSTSEEAKLSKIYGDFAGRVRPTSGPVSGNAPPKRLFDFDNQDVVRLRHHEQRRSWLFRTQRTSGYLVEVFAFSTFEYKQREPCQREERWGIRIFHRQWAKLFRENARLSLGQCVKWQAAESQFFPPKSDGCDEYSMVEGMEFENGSGFEELFHVLKLVEKVAFDLDPPVPLLIELDEVVDQHVAENQNSATAECKRHLQASKTLGLNMYSSPTQRSAPLEPSSPQLESGKATSSADSRNTVGKSFHEIEASLYNSQATPQSGSKKFSRSRKKKSSKSPLMPIKDKDPQKPATATTTSVFSAGKTPQPTEPASNGSIPYNPAQTGGRSWALVAGNGKK